MFPKQLTFFWVDNEKKTSESTESSVTFLTRNTGEGAFIFELDSRNITVSAELNISGTYGHSVNYVTASSTTLKVSSALVNVTVKCKWNFFNFSF